MKLLVVLFLSFPLSAAPFFVRAGAGFEQTGDAALRDRDCASTNPPALFGCGFGANGDFGGTPVWEVAAGVGDRARIELALSGRNEVDLDANANFTGVGERQPVHANGDALSAMLNASFEIAPRAWRVRPFVTAGAGAARNRTGSVTYAFPSIGPDAVTVAPGGSHTGFAWAAGAGVSIDLSERFILDVALRHTDLGELRTEAGDAVIVRPSRTLVLAIDGAETNVESRGVSVSLRVRLDR